MKFPFGSIFSKGKTSLNMSKADTTTASKYKVTEEELSSLREAFTLYDTDKNGGINLDQFASIIKSLDMETDDEKIKVLVQQVDTNHDGSIDFEEFVNAMNKIHEALKPDNSLKKWDTCPSLNKEMANTNKSHKRSYSRRMSRHETDELKLCFAKFDKNGDGLISIDELKDVMNGLGEKLTDQEFEDMMNDADTNKDRYIDFEEFKALMPTLDTAEQ